MNDFKTSSYEMDKKTYYKYNKTQKMVEKLNCTFTKIILSFHLPIPIMEIRNRVYLKKYYTK